jgi:hypothetical protein
MEWLREWSRGKRSQGGVKVPTGGECEGSHKPASARLPNGRRGQQIRCNSEADGHSPDGRERDVRGFFDAIARWRATGSCALILVVTSVRQP